MSWDVLLQDFFHESSFPKTVKITLGSFQNFFEISLRYSQVKMHHWHQHHLWQIATSINDIGAKFANGVNDKGGKQYQPTYTLKWSWGKNCYLCVNCTTQRCPDKIIKLFWMKIFSICQVANIKDNSAHSANAEMFKSWISWPRFSKISCYRQALGTKRIQFLQKSIKKFMLVYL